LPRAASLLSEEGVGGGVFGVGVGVIIFPSKRRLPTLQHYDPDTVVLTTDTVVEGWVVESLGGVVTVKFIPNLGELPEEVQRAAWASLANSAVRLWKRVMFVIGVEVVVDIESREWVIRGIPSVGWRLG
jgi:hypothetical protein